MNALRGVFRLTLVLWAGSLWSLAAWVAWSLFSLQPDRRVAGLLAARFFSIETYLGLGVAVAALVMPTRKRFFWAYVAVLLLLVNEWALKPAMVAARAQGALYGLNFGAWHGVSAVLYLCACLAVVRLVWTRPEV